MHDDYTQQQMESTLQKVFGIATASSVPTNPYSSGASTTNADDPDLRPPAPKRASRAAEHAEFPSTSIADFFNLNGAQNPANRLSFPAAADLTPFVPQQPTPTNSETWARLLAAGTTNGLSPLSSLDEAFVEIFADKVANKVAAALSPQIQQIRTAIIGLARLVEMNQTVAVDKRVQSPPTPPQQTQDLILSGVVTAPVSSSSTKKRNPSPSKVDPPTTANVVIAETESALLNAIKPASAKANNGPANAKTERKTGDGKSNPKRTVKEVPDVYRIIKLDDLAVHFNMTEKLCLLCRETFTESHLHSVKRHMYRKHRGELDAVLQRKTNDPFSALLGEKQTQANVQAAAGSATDLITIVKGEFDGQDQNELIDVVDVGNNDQNKFQSSIPL